jgi:hypothetical protein
MDYVTVNYKGLDLKLMQEPYINDQMLSGVQRRCVYEALAIDDNDDEYMVTWNVINLDCEDESEACNWDKFTVTAL